MGSRVSTLEKAWAPQTLERILGEHPLLRGCEPHYIQLLVDCASNVRFDAGEVIFHQGAEANLFYLIRHGRVALEIPGSARGPIITRR